MLELQSFYHGHGTGYGSNNVGNGNTYLLHHQVKASYSNETTGCTLKRVAGNHGNYALPYDVLPMQNRANNNGGGGGGCSADNGSIYGHRASLIAASGGGQGPGQSTAFMSMQANSGSNNNSGPSSLEPLYSTAKSTTTTFGQHFCSQVRVLCACELCEPEYIFFPNRWTT